MKSSTHRKTGFTALAAVFALCALGLAGFAGAAQAKVVWLCHPGIAADPCEIPLDTTVMEPAGGSRVQTPQRPASADRPVDCFYVYPTVVSDQAGIYADQSRDPAVVSVAKYQAAGFSAGCRMFAPIYRQVTVAGVGPALAAGSSAFAVPYADVLEAWRDYLAHDNGGRGVVLIGHSQGSLILRKLITEQVDPDPAARRRLVGAFLMGGQVTVRAGQATGGDFKLIPLCTRRGQHGCTVAYSTYAADPSVPFFGDTNLDVISGNIGEPHGAGYQVACTDPGPLSGMTAPVGVTIPTEPFAPGFISVGVAITQNGPVPTAPTTWIDPPYRYAGGCQDIRGAHVYRYDPVGTPRRQFNEFPATWGTHLIDMNLGLERLTTIAQLQTQSWLDAGFAVGPSRKDARTGAATVTVTAPGAGTVTLSSRSGVRRIRQTVAGPGPLRLRVIPTRTTARALRRHHRAAVTFAVTYAPAGRPPITRVRRLSLRRG